MCLPDGRDFIIQRVIAILFCCDYSIQHSASRQQVRSLCFTYTLYSDKDQIDTRAAQETHAEIILWGKAKLRTA